MCFGELYRAVLCCVGWLVVTGPLLWLWNLILVQQGQFGGYEEGYGYDEQGYANISACLVLSASVQSLCRLGRSTAANIFLKQRCAYLDTCRWQGYRWGEAQKIPRRWEQIRGRKTTALGQRP